METWLRDHLVATGAMTPGGLTRRARVRTCTTCQAWIFAGLDAELMAGEAKTDLAPLSPFGELVARTAGIETYNLRWVAGHYELDYRDHWEIASNPPGSRPNVDVVAAHRCGIDIAHTGPSRLPMRRVTGLTDNNNPPF